MEMTGFGTGITKKALTRSALMALLLTVVGLGFQVLRTRLFLHAGPPHLGRIVGLTVCYLVMAFAYALGFFLIEKRIPGRSQVGKGLLYSAMVIAAVWISGFINMFAIDFDGLWDMLSPAKINIYWMAAIDILNLAIGGLVLGLITRKDGQGTPVKAVFSVNLAARIALAALALPLLCAGIFRIVAAALPSGYDLSGERTPAFYLFLFAPYALTGAGVALSHAALRSGEGGILSEPLKICLFVFIMYWVTNTVFVLFFGFTWQVVVDFLVAGAISLFLSIVALEKIARIPKEPERKGFSIPRR
jgi:hypothetical protein